MALGTVTTILQGSSLAVECLASATATNGAPATAGAGIEMNSLRIGGEIPSTIRVGVISTAGSGTMTVTLKVWLYYGATIGWVMAKALNAGAAIAETSTDSIRYMEEVTTAYGASRLYLEIAAIAGTLTAVTGYAIAAA